MSNTINKKITNTDSDAEAVIINKILFDTMYKKRITLKDWLYTKYGLASIATLVLIWWTDELKVIHLLMWLAFAFTMLKKNTILAHTKEKNIWGKVVINNIVGKIEEIKPFRERLETDQIIEECTITPKRKVKKRRKKRRIKS